MSIYRDTDLNLARYLPTIFWILKPPLHHESVVAEEVRQREKEEQAVDQDYI